MAFYSPWSVYVVVNDSIIEQMASKIMIGYKKDAISKPKGYFWMKLYSQAILRLLDRMLTEVMQHVKRTVEGQERN